MIFINKQQCFTEKMKLNYTIYLDNGADRLGRTEEFVGTLLNVKLRKKDERAMTSRLSSRDNYCEQIRIGAWVKVPQEYKVGLILFPKSYSIDEGWIELYNKNETTTLYIKASDIGGIKSFSL